MSQWLFLENIVMALAPSFIILFRYNFIQVFGVSIPYVNLRFSMIGSRYRSQCLFLEKNFVINLVPFFLDGF